MTITDAEGQLVTRPSCAHSGCRLSTNDDRLPRDCPLRTATADFGDQPAPTSAVIACSMGLIKLTVPIKIDDQQLGTIVVGDRPELPVDPQRITEVARREGLDPATLLIEAQTATPWTEQQRQAMLKCAHLLAKTIGQLCTQDLMIRERVNELATVYDLSGLLSGTRDLSAILKTMAQRTNKVMRVKACAIRLLDEATGELIMVAAENLSAAYQDKGPVMLNESHLDAAALAGETVYIENVAEDDRFRYPAEAGREGLVSALYVGMTHRGQTVGVIRVYTDHRYQFSSFDVALLRAIASLAAAAVLNSRLFNYQRASERYQRQVRYAAQIQGRMLPVKPPRHAHILLASEYAPSLEVGGDFFDYLELPWGNVGLCVADVVGKGVPAALMMASVRAALRGHAHTILEINEIISRVNRHLCRDTVISEFATLFYGVFSPDGTPVDLLQRRPRATTAAAGRRVYHAVDRRHGYRAGPRSGLRPGDGRSAAGRSFGVLHRRRD